MNAVSATAREWRCVGGRPWLPWRRCCCRARRRPVVCCVAGLRVRLCSCCVGARGSWLPRGALSTVGTHSLVGAASPCVLYGGSSWGLVYAVVCAAPVLCSGLVVVWLWRSRCCWCSCGARQRVVSWQQQQQWWAWTVLVVLKDTQLSSRLHAESASLLVPAGGASYAGLPCVHVTAAGACVVLRPPALVLVAAVSYSCCCSWPVRVTQAACDIVHCQGIGQHACDKHLCVVEGVAWRHACAGSLHPTAHARVLCGQARCAGHSQRLVGAAAVFGGSPGAWRCCLCGSPCPWARAVQPRPCKCRGELRWCARFKPVCRCSCAKFESVLLFLCHLISRFQVYRTTPLLMVRLSSLVVIAECFLSEPSPLLDCGGGLASLVVVVALSCARSPAGAVPCAWGHVLAGRAGSVAGDVTHGGAHTTIGTVTASSEG